MTDIYKKSKNLYHRASSIMNEVMVQVSTVNINCHYETAKTFTVG